MGFLNRILWKLKIHNSTRIDIDVKYGIPIRGLQHRARLEWVKLFGAGKRPIENDGWFTVGRWKWEKFLYENPMQGKISEITQVGTDGQSVVKIAGMEDVKTPGSNGCLAFGMGFNVWFDDKDYHRIISKEFEVKVVPIWDPRHEYSSLPKLILILV